MGNPALATSFLTPVADWLAEVVGDATNASLYSTLKFDRLVDDDGNIIPPVPASGVPANAGAIWANDVDDHVRSVREVFQGDRGIRSLRLVNVDDDHLSQIEWREGASEFLRWRLIFDESSNLVLSAWDAAGAFVRSVLSFESTTQVLDVLFGLGVTSDLTLRSAAGAVVIGLPGTSGNAQVRFLKGDANNQTCMLWRAGATGTATAENSWALQHDTSEGLNWLAHDAAGAAHAIHAMQLRRSLTNGRSSIGASRIYTDLGTLPTAGAFALSAGWGTTATLSSVTAGSNDMRGRVTVTSNGTGQAAAPTVTYTFVNGTFGAAPFFHTRMNGGTGATQTIFSSSTATTLVMTFNATPVAGLTYVLEWVLFP